MCTTTLHLRHCRSCSYVVVVEKDAVFQRLAEDGFAEETGAILVTAKGMPDMATRAFLHSLCTALPHLQQFGGDSSSWLPAVTST